eukprot:gb/GEZN01008288.1/.p1 GENE.gb/GEZN01008288.1/~~gb/GEZN01008288.1/.p1  ORF type:complete len:440 (-),score=67.46 gb/GEZN01008288.1/:89-1408(-)
MKDPSLMARIESTGLQQSASYPHIGMKRTPRNEDSTQEKKQRTYHTESAGSQEVEQLQEEGQPDLEAKATQDGKALEIALSISCGDYAAIQALLQQEPSLREAVLLDDDVQDTILTRSARLGKLDLVKALITQAGLNPRKGKPAGPVTDDWSDSGAPPVCIAAYYGHGELVEWMIVEAKCPVDSSDDDAATVLHHAAWVGHTDIIRMLVRLGADLEAKDVHGRTPIAGAVWRARLPAMRLLVQLGADVDSHDDDDGTGTTALGLAAENGSVESVRVLIRELGATVDAEEADGSTPLIDAAWAGHLEVVKVLVEEGEASIDHTDSEGKSAIYIAAEQKKFVVVSYLAEKTAKLSNKDDKVWQSDDVLRALENGVHARERQLICPYLDEALFETVQGMVQGLVDLVRDYTLASGWKEVTVKMGTLEPQKENHETFEEESDD